MAPTPITFANPAPQEPQRVVLATSGAQWDARYSHPVPHTNSYYAKCCLGGVLSCGLTHLAVTPLDVAKCNMQV
jgi:solute carrier family 25 phosphate transporter 3